MPKDRKRKKSSGARGDAIYKIAMQSSKTSLVHIKEALEETYVKLSAAMESKDGLMGVPTGFPRLDRTLSGLQGGQLIVIAGRPGMGKTSFALNIVEHLAMVKKVPCLIFSLEMAADQLAGRLLSSESKVDSQKIRSGSVSEQEIHKIADAIKSLKTAPVYIDDSALITATEMLAKAHRLKKSEDVGLIVIDYLQLMSGSGRAENRQQEIAQLTRTLKVMAKELDLPIVLYSRSFRVQWKNAIRVQGGPCCPTCANRAPSSRMPMWLCSCTGKIIMGKKARLKTSAKRRSLSPSSVTAPPVRFL